MLGLGLGLASAALRGTVWRPGFLFKGGQSGLWGNIQEGRPMRLFQDAAGTTPANQAGQPVGKVARAAGTVDASQATALSRPTLARVPKGGRRNLRRDLSTVPINCTVVNNGNGEYTLAATSVERARVTLALPVTLDIATYSMSCEFKSPDSELRCMALCLYNSGPSRTVIFDTEGEFVAGENLGNATYSCIAVGDGWHRLTLTGDMPISPNGGMFWFATYSKGSVVSNGPYSQIGATIRVRKLQVERSAIPTPYQHVTSVNDITEAGVPDVWHLWNDGGDSLLAPLPTGAHEVATVTPMGKVDYATVTGDGTGKNILFGERVADIFARAGTLTDAERARLEEYWQQRYGAGYLIQPGMVPGARGMWQDASGTIPASAAGQALAMVLDGSSGATRGAEIISGGPYTVNNALQTVASLSPSKVHEVSFTVSDYSGSGLIGIESGTFSNAGAEVRRLSGNGTVKFIGITRSTPDALRLNTTDTAAGKITISVKEIPGAHGYQPTTLSRPTLARWPKGGRRNLARISHTPVDAQWFKANTTVTGDQISFTASNSSRITQNIAITGSGLSLTISVAFSAPDAGKQICLGVWADGIVGTAAGRSPVYTIPPDGLVSHTWTGLKDVTAAGIINSDAVSKVLTLSGVRGLQVELGGVLTSYQTVNSDTDVTEVGVPDVWHLYNDGGDSLPAVLPAGAYEIAWVNHLGVIGYASVTSDGITGTDLLRAERMADVALKRGRFTSYEKAQLETQWGKYKP